MVVETPGYATLMKPTKALRPKQIAMLAFIREYIGRHGYAPKLDEIGAACGSVRSNVHHNLLQLQKAGKVRVAPGISRGIVLTDGGPCPHCGRA